MYSWVNLIKLINILSYNIFLYKYEVMNFSYYLYIKIKYKDL